MFQVAEINSLQDLAGLRQTWAALLAQTAWATFFQTAEWLETYWKFYGTGDGKRPAGKLRVLVVEADGQPIGILPLAVMTEPYRIGSVRVMGYPLAGWGSFYGPIGPLPAATLSAGLQHIYRTPRDWDLLDLRWVDSATDQSATPQAFARAGFNFETQIWHESAQVEIEQGWDAYWNSRKPRWRSNVRRCQRLLEKQGSLEHLRYRPAGAIENDTDPRWDLYDACVELARRSWQGQSTTGTTMSHESIREYLRAAHETAVRAGAVDINLLRVGGKPVAFAYNYHFRHSIYGLRSGFDPKLAHDGPGNVLMAKMIEDGCHRGDSLIDLGPNYLDCKRNWLTRLQPAYHYTHFNPARLRAQALRLKRIVKRWLGNEQFASNPEPIISAKNLAEN